MLCFSDERAPDVYTHTTHTHTLMPSERGKTALNSANTLALDQLRIRMAFLSVKSTGQLRFQIMTVSQRNFSKVTCPVKEGGEAGVQLTWVAYATSWFHPYHSKDR